MPDDATLTLRETCEHCEGRGFDWNRPTIQGSFKDCRDCGGSGRVDTILTVDELVELVAARLAVVGGQLAVVSEGPAA